MTADPIEIGATFWMYDHSQGHRHGAEKYKQVVVIGETRVSWLISPAWAPIKIPKRDPSALMNADEKEQHKWVRDHYYKIARKVTAGLTYEDLRKIAAIVGYHA